MRRAGRQARPAIPHRQSLYVQRCRRDEAIQLTVSRALARGIERHLDRAEWQLEPAAPQIHFRAVLRHEPPHEAPVVQLGGEADAGIEPARRRAGALGEEEGVGVDDGGQLMLPFPRRLAVQEGQLGQTEQELRSPRDATMARCSSASAASGRSANVLNRPSSKSTLRSASSLARGDGAASELAVHDLRIDPGRLARNGAGGEG